MTVFGAVLLTALAVLLVWPGSPVFLVAFSALLVALLLDGLAYLLMRLVPVPATLARLMVVALLGLAILAFFLLAGPRFSEQASELADRLPAAIDQVRDAVSHPPLQTPIENLDPGALAPSGKDIVAGITGVFSTVFTLIANIAAILVIGLYLALQPRIYVRGVLHLVPENRRERAREILFSLGHALRWWLVGRFASMAGVGLLTTLGLWLIDMPLALVLGVIAGLFSFVPYIGPITSIVPALLIALTESLPMALWVTMVYVAVQFIEGNFLTPLIQRRAVSLPPAVLLLAQFALGLFYGLFGVLLATPLAIAVIVLVQMLWVQSVVGEPIRVLGDHSPPAR
ncbi:AI-2E family transporter [Lentisalinibacter sediminis]|uniref:AI-2E family transporter n=1 Tax=Lentisalinibacter sediminis TaxID=2992237 RepID=UPI00386C4A35